jgi:hypothetical protein
VEQPRERSDEGALRRAWRADEDRVLSGHGGDEEEANDLVFAEELLLEGAG